MADSLAHQWGGNRPRGVICGQSLNQDACGLELAAWSRLPVWTFAAPLIRRRSGLSSSAGSAG